MPKGKALSVPDDEDPDYIKAVQILQQQHTALHQILYKSPRKGNKQLLKADIAKVISALANAIALI